ncbi:MAG: hypothetical protein WA981_16820 [Glaciecola sp.]
MKVILLTVVLFMVGCSSTSNPLVYSNTMDVIGKAANAAPSKVYGKFLFKIQATGEQREIVYLNTELDYRDQRNITIALHPKILPQLEAKYGDSPTEVFIGKSIYVKGYAQRVRIGLFSEGRATGKYYFQTHIPISDISKIEIVN